MAMRLIPELPLFRRELTEMAQRRRTYVVRVVGAIGLTLAAFWIAPASVRTFGAGMNPWMPAASMGAGQLMFQQIVSILFFAIPVLMPALCCTSITSEKEQNTLGTLLLTRLSPLTILLEKLFSRIVPMLTLLLLVSPVMAYAYSLGGVDRGQLFGAMFLLFVECWLFASLALMSSAWCPTSVSAFVMSYVMTFLLVVFSQELPVTARSLWTAWNNIDVYLRTTGTGFLNESQGVSYYLWGVRWPVAMAGMFLLLARSFLVSRAFVGSSSLLLKMFRRMDVFFRNLNSWTTGGIEIAKESNVLPEYDPVTWRERNKKSLGQLRWLVRVLLALEGPTFLICCMVVIIEPYRSYTALYPLLTLLWILSVIIAAVKGTSLFGQERSRQTLEALLSTSLSTRELLTQKIAGTNRLMFVLACPLASVCITEAVVLSRGGTAGMLATGAYLLVSGLLILLILRTIFWMTALVGIAVHSHSRAILLSMMLVTGWAALPYAGYVILAILGVHQPQYDPYATAGPMNAFALLDPRILSPVGSVLTTEVHQFLQRDGYVRGFPGAIFPGNGQNAGSLMIVGLVVQGLTLLAVRSLALRLVPHLLNRHDKPTFHATEPLPAEYHYA